MISFITHLPTSVPLMEINGYKIQKKDGQFLFFKHGEMQGCINLSAIDKRISLGGTLNENIHQIKALIYKYRKQYSGKLRSTTMKGLFMKMVYCILAMNTGLVRLTVKRLNHLESSNVHKGNDFFT